MLTGSRKLILVLHTNPKSFIEAEWKSLALFLVAPFILCIYIGCPEPECVANCNGRASEKQFVGSWVMAKYHK